MVKTIHSSLRLKSKKPNKIRFERQSLCTIYWTETKTYMISLFSTFAGATLTSEHFSYHIL